MNPIPTVLHLHIHCSSQVTILPDANIFISNIDTNAKFQCIMRSKSLPITRAGQTTAGLTAFVILEFTSLVGQLGSHG
jgi:hypothetical protein